MSHTWQGGFAGDELYDRVVTLTVGQLTDALAEALKVVSDAEPTWKVGDKALIEVEVVGVLGERARVTFEGVGSISIPVSILEEIDQ